MMHPILRSERERIRESYHALKPDLAKYETIQEITVIWLDSRLNISLDCFDTHIRLRRMIDHLLTFNSKNAFLEYFNSEIQGEQIFLIVSGKDGELVIPQIHSTSKILSIYVFCNDISKHEQWTKAFNKICGVFHSKDALFEKLIKDIKLSLTNLLPIRILGKTDIVQKSLYDLTLEGARSMWFQLLIEALVKMKHPDEAKSDLLEICRKQYENNKAAQKKIDDFDQTYTPEKAIWWYTADSFLYRLLNKALRTENIDIVYKFRWFLYDLDHQIKEIHKKQLSSMKPIETFYRGQKIPAAEFKNLQENIGGYIAMNAFTSISKSCAVAVDFAGDGEERPELESVIFQIEINTAISPCADIKDLSMVQDEEEMLLTIGSVFRIVSIEQYDSRWFVELTLDKTDNEEMEELMKYLKIELFGTSPLLNLATILFQMSDYDRAEQYCIRADLELASNDDTRFSLYLRLGEIYRNGKGDYNKAKEMYDLALSHSKTLLQSVIIYNHVALLHTDIGKYDTALKTLEEAETLCHKNDLSDCDTADMLISTYANLGIVYRHKSEFVKALQKYNKALDISLKNLPKLHSLLSVLYNNIGYLNCIICDYDAALTAYEKALKIQLQTLPKTHTGLATVYNNMGTVYMAMEKHLQAMEYFEKALNMFRDLLETDHPTISLLHHNIGDAYYWLKQYDKAISYLEKALELRIQKLPSTHVQMAESYESLGWAYYELSQYEKALEFCNKALEIQPNRANAFYCMGMIYDSQCSYKNALFALQKAIDLYEKYPAKRSVSIVKIYETIANIYTIQEKPADAIKHYNKAIDVYHCEKVMNPVVFIEIYNARGRFFCNTERYADALSDLEMALDMVKNSKEDLLLPSILTQIGHLHLQQQHFEEALKYLQDAEKAEIALSVAEHPKKFERLWFLADLFYQQNNYDAALENYENALQILSQRSSFDRHAVGQIQMRLGRTYEKKCLHDKSLKAFQEALDLFSMIFEDTHQIIVYLHYKIACMCKKHENHANTLEAFKKALDHQLHSISINYSQLAEIYDNLGDLMIEQNEIGIANYYCEQSLEIRSKHSPNDVSVSYANMAILKTHQEQYLEAQQLFQKAIEEFSPDSRIVPKDSLGKNCVQLALTYNKLGEYNKAMETISMANQVQLSDDQNLNSLIAYATGYIYQMQNQYDEALKYYEEVLSKSHLVADDKTLAMACMQIADIYYDQKQFALAIEYCKKRLNYKPTNAALNAIYQSLARIYVAFGQEEEQMKVEYYKKAIDNFMKILMLPVLDNKEYRKIHGLIANLYRQVNNIDLAIKHYEILRDDLLKLSPRNYNELLAVCETLIYCCTCQPDKQKLIENYKFILSIFLNDDDSSTAKDFKKAAMICNNMSVLYYEDNDFVKAIEYTEQEVQLELKVIVSSTEPDDETMFSLASSYLNLSTLYEESGDIRKQIKTLEKLLDIYKKFVSTSNLNSPKPFFVMARVCESLSDCYETIGDSSLALNYYQESFDFRNTSGTMNETKFSEYQKRLAKLRKSKNTE